MTGIYLCSIIHLETYEEDGTFLFARERTDVIDRERSLGGYFAIVTSEKMAAKEAPELYKSRDAGNVKKQADELSEMLAKHEKQTLED